MLNHSEIYIHVPDICEKDFRELGRGGGEDLASEWADAQMELTPTGPAGRSDLSHKLQLPIQTVHLRTAVK